MSRDVERDGGVAAPARAYRGATFAVMARVLGAHVPIASALDFGAGDGWYASQMQQGALVGTLTCVDVQARPRSFVPVTVYDGIRLPFPDRSFELVYAVDVLHHCHDPRASLTDLLRCSATYALIKDHTWRTTLGRWTLAGLDELGNRRFGVPSVYHYQRGWEWDDVLTSAGFELVERVHPAACEPRPWGVLTNGLQYVGLWRRR